MTRDEFVKLVDELRKLDQRADDLLAAFDAQAAEYWKWRDRAEKAESALSAMTAERDEWKSAWEKMSEDHRADLHARLKAEKERDEAEARGRAKALAALRDSGEFPMSIGRIERLLLPAAPSTKEGDCTTPGSCEGYVGLNSSLHERSGTMACPMCQRGQDCGAVSPAPAESDDEEDESDPCESCGGCGWHTGLDTDPTGGCHRHPDGTHKCCVCGGSGAAGGGK